MPSIGMRHKLTLQDLWTGSPATRQLDRNGVAGSVEMECRLVSHRSSRHRDCNLVHEYSFFHRRTIARLN
jgi:hypothetical protein